MEQKLAEGLEKLGFTGPDAQELGRKMELYINEIQLFNSAYNLVDAKDKDELITRHILDSLAGAAVIRRIAEAKEKPVIGDIGSGGGLPGIPLAAALPGYSFRLIERMSKRCAFLENCAAILGLPNVTVINQEAEKAEKQSIDIAVFRAFRPLDAKMTRTLLALLKHDGVLAAYKAKADKIKEEMSGIADIVPSYTVEPLTVPFLTDTGTKETRERNLVLIGSGL